MEIIRNWLRKTLIGKNVHFIQDYIRPGNENFEERTCVSVFLGSLNISEALVSKGLASPLRHRHDDENRAYSYDALLLAEKEAIKSKVGIHSDIEVPSVRQTDASENVTKAKSFLSMLKRSGKQEAVCDYAFNGRN